MYVFFKLKIVQIKSIPMISNCILHQSINLSAQLITEEGSVLPSIYIPQHNRNASL